MRKMKDSGIPWIGEIPTDWSVSALKKLTTCLDGQRVPVDASERNAGPYPYWGAGNIVDYVDKYLFDEKLVLLGEDGAPFFDPYRPVAFFVNEKIWVNNHIHVLKAKNGVDSKFLMYCLNSVDFNQYINGSILSKLTQSNMNKIMLCLPSIDLQNIIALYLDTKCSQIDSTIDNIHTLIDKLKEYKQSVITHAVTKGLNPDVPMKYSGVPWIGEIPETWDVISLKFLTSKIGSGKTPLGGAEAYQNSGIMFLRSQNIYDEGLRIDDIAYISNNIHEEMSNTKVHYNDILLNITGASIGRCCLFTLEDTEANVNQHVCIIRLKNKLCAHNYIRYVLNSYVGKSYINLFQIGGNRQGLNFEQIGNIKILYPQHNIQKLIIDYLDDKCRKIDTQISEQESLLAKLEAYKKSLIYECVTGKREVPAA